MRRENEGHFGRAWRAGAKRGKFLSRMACAGKMRVILGAHIMRRENEGHFGRAYHAQGKSGSFSGIARVQQPIFTAFWALIVCSGQFSLHFGH